MSVGKAREEKKGEERRTNLHEGDGGDDVEGEEQVEEDDREENLPLFLRGKNGNVDGYII